MRCDKTNNNRLGRGDMLNISALGDLMFALRTTSSYLEQIYSTAAHRLLFVRETVKLVRFPIYNYKFRNSFIGYKLWSSPQIKRSEIAENSSVGKVKRRRAACERRIFT